MDDLRTKETLDALADLFLTGTTPSRKPPGAPGEGDTGGSSAPVRTPPRKGPPSSAASASITPTITANNDTLDAMAAAQSQVARALGVLDELDGPGAIPLGTPNTSAARYGVDDYEPAPAPTLRLHDDNDPANDRAIQPARIEAVFLGNLPGFAGPWLTQYAFHVAQQRGPVVVLRLAGDRVDLELVTAERQSIRPGIDDPLPNDADLDALVDRLDQLAGNRSAPVVNWLLHLPAPTEPAQLARAAGIAHWTVLCGGDDMAVAAAARLLQALNDAASRDGAAPSPRRVGVIVMGGDESKAREAVDKLNAAAAGFLRQPVELVGSRRQMTPVHMRPLGGCANPEIWPVLQGFFSDLPTAEPLAASHSPACSVADPQTPVAAPLTETPATTALPSRFRDESTPIESESPVYDSTASAVLEPPSEVEHLTGIAAEPVAAAPLRRAPEPAQPQASSSPRAPRTQPAAAPKAEPSSINEPNLADLLTGTLAGGIALQARHPKQRDTQLLLDQSGKLHLLRRQIGSDLRAALVDLLETRDWVHEHIELLALTQRQCAFDTAAEPTLHLFTADAKNAVAMVNKLGPFVKLHLLQEVRIGSTKTWVCTDLN